MNATEKAICLTENDYSTEEIDETQCKKQALLQMWCDWLSTQDADLSNSFITDLVDIIEANLFRPLPAPRVYQEFLNIGPSFPILNSTSISEMACLVKVYELLARLIEIYQDQIEFLSVFIDTVFVKELLNLIKSEDEEERALVTQIVAKIATCIESHRSTIYFFIINSLYEILDNQSCIHVFTDNLLVLLHEMICWEQLPECAYANGGKRLLGIFLRLQQQPTLYYYYTSLFSCSIAVLGRHQDHLGWFIQQMLTTSLGQYSLSRHNFCITTNRMLTLIALSHHLRLLFKLIGDNTQKNEFQRVFNNLVPLITKLIVKNLQSHNEIIIARSIKLLVTHKTYFEPHMDYLKSELLPVLSEANYDITWDNSTYTQQILFLLALQKA